MSIFCNLPKNVFHSWGQWTTIEKMDIGHRYSYEGKPVEGSDTVIGSAFTQKRTCACCGLSQVKTIKTKI